MKKPSELILKSFPFTPTNDQHNLIEVMDGLFEETRNGERVAMLIKGYAGTGKTTIVNALVKSLPQLGYRYVLMAPTGRAAKIMAQYTGKRAYTMHKRIYTFQEEDGHASFALSANKSRKTIFMVDEASMISDELGGSGRNMLSDLMDYVFTDETNKLLLIGDNAQLPPVGLPGSVALDESSLQIHYNLVTYGYELKEVVRQKLESGILYNATQLRQLLENHTTDIKFTTAQYPDIYRMTSDKLEDGLRYAYQKFGVENTVIICRSNKNAVNFNQYIRRGIHFYEDEIGPGDLLMIVKNNYHWLKDDSQVGFLANGEFAEVMKVLRYEEAYGHRFADVSLRLLDYDGEKVFEAKILLDTLYSPSASLTMQEWKELRYKILKDYEEEELSPRQQANKLTGDPYLNVLQVKFAYALTCHKSQGGQWPAVFVDQGYLTEDRVDATYIRWLYTAVTRASEELYLVNFNSQFF